jgi:putative transcriptional regulator
MKSLERHFLVASRQLLDPNFVKSVVLLIRHNEEGALGVVINRPTSKTLGELWKEIGDEPCEAGRPVCMGGPVPGPLLAIHANSFFAEMEVLKDVFLAAKKESLDELVMLADDPLKLFLGHAGWGAGQLEGEIESGAWLTMPASFEYVFYEGEDLWETVTRKIGERTLQSMLHIRHIPDDPTLN